MSPSEHHQAPGAALKVARIYMRVSTEDQDLNRQDAIVESTKAAGIYREKASGARADRAELLRLIADLQPGEVVVAERIDRISRLPLVEAEPGSLDQGQGCQAGSAWCCGFDGAGHRGERRGQGCPGIRPGHAFEAGVTDRTRRLRGSARAAAARCRAGQGCWPQS